VVGGGVVRLPRGVCILSDTLTLGDGSNSAQSSKHHNITLEGYGIGTGAEVSNTQTTPPTVLRYAGTTDTTKAVLSVAGPLHNLYLRDFALDANGKAGIGLKVVQLNDWQFQRIQVLNWTTNSYVFTTRTGYPSGVAYGMSNGSCLDCFAYGPASNTANGILWTSGVAGATSLVGNPDVASNRFIGGVFFYGGSTGSYGLKLDGADNNIVIGSQLIPKGGNDGGGKSITFAQWAGSTQWPLENLFVKLGITQNVSGTSGTDGNAFLDFATSDGAAIPSLANVRTIANDGHLSGGWIPQITATTVGALPTCNAAAEGTEYGVTDANATTFHASVAAGGSNHVQVYCNGTNWVIGG